MDDREKMIGILRDLDVLRNVHGSSVNQDRMDVADRLIDAGYRLDPYPNGKSKGELIARIEELEGELARARNLLREEHNVTCPDHRHNPLALNTGCDVCALMLETSTVKP